MEKYTEVERSIIKRFRKEIWRKFITAVNDYQLIKEGDKIAVCISGGKDSMLLAKCMQELKKHGKFHFDLVFMVMDPGYNPYNKQIILDNAEYLNIPIEVFNSNIFEVVASVPDSPCYLCAKMRRGYLYKHAQELGCNKIALGHHFDDVIETVLMSMLYSGQMKGMMPKLHSTNYEGMELIRPLYMVKEADILAWKKYNNLTFIQCACRLTENCMLGDNGIGSKRQEMKELVKKFRQTSSVIDMNIFRSIHNVNLDTMIGYQKHQVSHSFLDEYDSKLTAENMTQEE
ncbi:tRNA 2-thiocytidine biosynthesis TtcA family protein [Anaerocolumna xylanovorans]|uniref:tRNA(Ile)-lysidine synthase TilS/MesJ n=1 Tax=Anaerocolumna xylanovorans DSM 12503 TaxID=1121345 RepID=A0A1M7Y0F7_9FIRM|nr:ATP-binding protein [Anaerocolumna xylanovorans]SHO45019.1 tRNA(Ile)-lysidine synthase TilS/MesJ [Anaerocolumna xylanovorans DSM 12503]